MTNDLLDRSITSALRSIVDRAPDLGPLPTAPSFTGFQREARRPPRLLTLTLAGAAFVGVGVIVSTRRAHEPDASTASDAVAVAPTTSAEPSSTEAIGPTTAASSPAVGRTLPALSDSAGEPSPTLPAGAPLSYWRMLPDLDIAERDSPSMPSGTELCYRTPVGEGCIDDSFLSPQVGVVPTDGAVIVLARPGLIPIDPPSSDAPHVEFRVGPNPSVVRVTFTDGSVSVVALQYSNEFGIGVARVVLPEGARVLVAESSD